MNNGFNLSFFAFLGCMYTEFNPCFEPDRCMYFRLIMNFCSSHPSAVVAYCILAAGLQLEMENWWRSVRIDFVARSVQLGSLLDWKDRFRTTNLNLFIHLGYFGMGDRHLLSQLYRRTCFCLRVVWLSSNQTYPFVL